MSDRDLYLSSGPGLLGTVAGVLMVIGCCAALWALLHHRLVSSHLLTVWRRGRAYRARIRAARHVRRPSLVRSLR
jgi:hypothetical protein